MSDDPLIFDDPIGASGSLEESLIFQAGAGEGSFGSLMGGDASDMRLPLMYLDPMMDQVLTMFPQDNLRELYRRLRHYYTYDPVVRASCDFHTETPLSDFFCSAPASKDAEIYYNDFKDRKNLFNLFINITRDYNVLGEGFAYGNWDRENQEYSEFIQLPPEEVEVRTSYISTQRVYLLRPNREIMKTMRSINLADRAITNAIKSNNPSWAQAAMSNKAFMMDPNRLFILQREKSAYHPRGVSPLLAVVKDLMFQDFLNLFRTVFIQRHSFPLRIFKLGSEAKGFIPNRKMMHDFQVQLAKSISDPNYNLITHPFVTVESHTGHDKILPLIPYYDHVKSRIMNGLGVSEAIISGEKTPYAAGITFMRGLMNKYITFRNNLQNEAMKKIWIPLARKRGFYQPTEAEVKHKIKVSRTDKQLILPKMMWEKANLLSHQAIQQMLISMQEKGNLPAEYVYEMFGFEAEDVLYRFQREQGTRSDPIWQKVREDLATKDEEVALAILEGKDIQTILKEKIARGKAAEEGEAPKDKAKPKPVLPGKKTSLPGSTSPLPPIGEGSGRPAEIREGGPAQTSPTAVGQPKGVAPVPGERKERPGEETGAGPGGAAGGTP